MRKQLTSASSLDNLKKEAKRWLKAIRAGDSDARARLTSAWPKAPDDPGLRDVQHALALEYGKEDWTALSDAVASASPARANDEIVGWFLDNATTTIVNGPSARARRMKAAGRLLAQHPDIARANIYTAVVCGDLDEVRRIIADDSAAATRKRSMQVGGNGGRRDCDPLMHLCFSRLPDPANARDAIEIAKFLLAHGADPNARFGFGTNDGSKYTAMCGVVGEGEEDAPPHPHRDALARLLLEHGAEPYDGQLIYNTHFHADLVWLLELVHEFSLKLGRADDWKDPEWSRIHASGYGDGARWFLRAAVQNDNLALAEWCLSRGATPNPAPARGGNNRWGRRSLVDMAVRTDHPEMAALLARYGGVAGPAEELSAVEQFIALCMKPDRDGARAMLAANPELLASPKPVKAAAAKDRVDVLEFLLELGFSPDLADPTDGNATPLHDAAGQNALRAAAFLIPRVADVEPVEKNWSATPLGFASYGQHREMVELLAPHSRDVWELTSLGKIERLRELIAANPSLAKTTGGCTTPLFWLPDDEQRAAEVVQLYLAHGADASVRDKNGKTAADYAEAAGLIDAARLLRGG